MFVFVFVVYFQAQTPVDLDNGTIIWTVDKAGPAPDGFQINCGPQSKQYNKIIEVLSPSARSILATQVGLGIW